MSKSAFVNAFAPARLGGARKHVFIASLAVLLGGPFVCAAQNIMPQVVCVEYYTAPVTGAIGAVRGKGDGGAFGLTHGKGYIAHFAYLSTEANDLTVNYGLLFGNFLSPGVQVSGNQPDVFHPGYSQTFSLPTQYSQVTWFLAGNMATVTPIGVNDYTTGDPLPPSPTCAPAFIPSTSLSFTQPGTYTQQYLGQVDSGPRAAADVQFAVRAISGDPNITYANLAYVPNDTANPTGSANPNSIYGDITVAYGAKSVSAVRLQLATNGTVVMKGLTPIQTSIQLPDLTVSAAHSPATFTVNDASDQITITAANIGTASTGGRTVTVTDTLPAGLTFVSSPTRAWACASGNPTAQTVQCTTSESIAANGTLFVVLKVSVAGSTNTPLTNSVTVACACTEESTTNNTNTDSIPVLQTTNVTLDTSPTGLQISGDGGTTFYTAPHTFQWLPGSQHTVVTPSPQRGGVGTQYVFASWSDSGAISHAIAVPAAASTYTASFTTQYMLTTGVNVAAAGSIGPGSEWVNAGSQVSLSATPSSAAYVFVNFTGAANSATNPYTVTVNAPGTVTANFNGGPTSLGGSLGIKSGPMNARIWPLAIGNNGPGEALGAQVSNLVLAQTAGTACTPVVGALPVIAGNLAPHATGTASVTIDFSSCQPGAVFKATFSLSANGGAATGTVVKTSQMP